MSRALLVAGALAAAAPAGAASARTGNDRDDVRCLLLSAGYARSAKDEGSRRSAAMTGAFFLGRLSGHPSGEAFAAAVRAQGKGMPPAQAEPLMRACAARAQAAEQAMTGAVRAAQGGR